MQLSCILNHRSGSSLFQGGLNIPGFSLTTKQTENKTNPLSILSTPSVPISGSIFGIPSIKLPNTTTNPISSSLGTTKDPTVKPSSSAPGITSIPTDKSNTASSANPIQLTNPTAITTTSLTTAKSTADTPASKLY